MAYKIEVNDPSTPKGEIVGVANNLVAVPNGGSAEMSDEDAAAFKEQTGMTVSEAFKDSETVKVSGSKGGDS
jgi:hypothetical protein